MGIFVVLCNVDVVNFYDAMQRGSETTLRCGKLFAHIYYIS